jgi:outer membrane receptor protein involved in Fe transport
VRGPAPRLRAACAAALLAGGGGPAGAAEDITELDAVIVTAPSADGTARTAPHGVSVITADDIARSTAKTVGDLLSREANLNLQSFTGNDNRSTIDIRGMGATASSNVLVLVDGVRLNENDLSAPDLLTIPLAQIERVEIIRGGGAVRYGNGAVGGVINIITKRARPRELRADVVGRVGSYSTTDLRASGFAGAGEIAASITLSKFDTDGYRQNGGVDAEDGLIDVRWLPTGALDFLELYGRAASHRDTSGLPGPVSAQAFAGTESQRRASNFPFDTSTTDDKRYTLGANAHFGAAGQLQVQGTYRDRTNPFFIGFNPNVPRANQQNEITSQRSDFFARYDVPFEAFGFRHSFSVGGDLEDGDYTRAQNGADVVDSSSRLTGNVDSKGVYAAATLRGPHALTLNAGIRFNRFSTDTTTERFTRAGCQTSFQTILVDVDPGPGVILVPILVPVQTGCVDAYRVQGTQGGSWRNRGVEIGLTWQPAPGFTGFASATQNFRNPNIDELLLAAPDLSPQTGRTYEVGARYSLAQRLELAGTLFYMRIVDEIFFGVDPATNTSVNFNLPDPTQRIGGEVELRWRPVDSLAVRAGAGYVDAQILGPDTTVPLVPTVTANAAIDWSPVPWFGWGLSAKYVSSRYDGNDFTNSLYPKLAPYTVADTVLRFNYGPAQLSLGVNNIFNEVYSTVGFSNTFFPMPQRNYYAALRLIF